jgi:biopolymer transport protein ExbD
MRIPGRPKHGASLDGDTMTPMIDVVFLLLVFFICASVGGTADKLLPAELKGSTESPEILAEPNPEQWTHPAVQIRIEPGATGLDLKLDQQSVPDLASLTDRLTRLSEADPATRIILDIHDDIQVQQFVGIYDLCQSLKFQNISFAVKNSVASRP